MRPVRIIAKEAAARGDEVSATRAWSAILEGRWVLAGVTTRRGVRTLVFRLARPRLGHREGMSRDEATALAAAVAGRGVVEIAEEMSTSPARAARLVTSAMKKLGIGSRVELAAWLGR